jgi:hypothetical protein
MWQVWEINLSFSISHIISSRLLFVDLMGVDQFVYYEAWNFRSE